MDSALQIVSLVGSLIAIIVALGGWFYWRGTIDATLKQFKHIPEQVSDHNTKIDVLWKLFVEKTLEGGKFAVRGSPYKLTEAGEKCVSDVAHIIETIQRKYPDISPSDVLTKVAQEIGMAELGRFAKKNGCSSAEYLSLLTIKLGIEV
jgi:hypothetical protein